MNIKESLRGLVDRPRMKRRVWMTAVGVLLCGVVVGIFKTAAYGVDPFQALCAGLNNVIPIPFGTLYMLINLVLLIGMFLVDKHYIGLGTLINLFLLGFMVQLSQAVLGWFFPDPSLVARVVMMIIAIPLLCAASALYFAADLGVSTYDVWALVLTEKTKLPFRFLRIGTDLICVGVGFCLLGFRTAGMIGVGTIITALFMGPLIDLFNRKLAQPLLYGKDGNENNENGNEPASK